MIFRSFFYFSNQQKQKVTLHVFYRESGDSVELTVGSYDTFEILYDLDVPINEDLLQNWPEMEALQVPDFSELDNFFKNPSLAAVSEVPKTVAKTVAETVAEAAAEEVISFA